MKKRGLGQGLSTLLGAEVSSASGEGFREVYTSQLLPGSSQPRQLFSEDEMSELAASIETNGVLQPLIVRAQGDNQYEIIAGERRWRAAKKIGLDRMPVLVRDFTDEEAQAVALIENVQRENLTPMEEARGYDRLMKAMKLSHEDVARMVGKSRTHVTNQCRLMLLPDSVQALIESRSLTPGHVKILVGLENAAELADIMVQKKMSVRRAELMVKRLKAGVPQDGAEHEATGSDGENVIPHSVRMPKAMHGAPKPTGPAAPIPAGIQFDPQDRGHLTPSEVEEIQQIEGFVASRVGCPVYLHIGYDRGRDLKLIFSLETRDELDDILSKISALSSA